MSSQVFPHESRPQCHRLLAILPILWLSSSYATIASSPPATQRQQTTHQWASTLASRLKLAHSRAVLRNLVHFMLGTLLSCIFSPPSRPELLARSLEGNTYRTKHQKFLKAPGDTMITSCSSYTSRKATTHALTVRTLLALPPWSLLLFRQD